MSILGPDGEVLEGDKPTMDVAAGGSLKLSFGAAGGRIEVDGSNLVRFPKGEWIIMPLEIWTRTYAQAVNAAEQAIAPRNRAARRRGN